MKKIFILLSVIVSISFSLAQTSSVQSDEKLTTTAVTAPSSMDMIVRNIDRRIAYFNKYIQSGDITNIRKLVSEENKDFYTNFVRYVEKSPIFTIKRDVAQRIIKTPLDEYTFSALVSLDGKDTKVSMTFVEDTSGQSSKWLISDSNLHIQIPLPENEKSPLVSDALQTPTSTTKTPKTTDNVKTTTEPDTKTITESTATSSEPIKSTPTTTTDTQKSTTATMPSSIIPIPTPSAQSDKIIIISISLACILLIGSVILFIVKKRKGQKISSLALATSAAAGTIAIIPTEIAPVTPTVSNVSISTVEEIHNIPAVPAAPQVETALSDSEDTPSETPTVSEIDSIPEKVPETVPTISEAPIDSNPIEIELPTLETPTGSLEITPASSGENISPEQEIIISAENTPSVPLTESVTSTEESIPNPSIPDEEKQITANTPIVENEQEHKSLNQIIEDAIVETPPTPLHGNTHPLFENILNPVVTEETPSLFADILNSDTQKNTF